MFCRCSQLRYAFTLHAADPAWGYHRRVDEAYPRSIVWKTIDSVHGEDGDFLGNTKLISWLGGERNVGQSC